MSTAVDAGSSSILSSSSLKHDADDAGMNGHGLPPAKKRKSSAKIGINGSSGSGSGSGNGNGVAGDGGESSGSVMAGGNGLDGQKEAKKRTQSCDVCRARKVKCVKQLDAPRCEGCIALDQRCEYTHERKKPGPANSYARKPTPPLPPAAAQSFPPPQHPQAHHHHGHHHPHHHERSYSHGAGTSPTSFNFDTSMAPPRWTPPGAAPGGPAGHHHAPPPPPPASAHRSNSMPHGNGGGLSTSPYGNGVPAPVGGSASHHSQTLAGSNAFNSFGLDLSWLPISPDSLLHPQPGDPESSSEDSPMGRWAWMSGIDDFWDASLGAGGVPGAGGSAGNGGQLPTVMPDNAGPQSGGSSEQSQPHSRSQPNHRRPSVHFDFGKLAPPPEAHSLRRVEDKCLRLEDVAPFSTITRILHAYHAHLYPLMPVVHWPTFSQQLVAREDERSDTWRAFVLSLVAYSIIQLPRSALHFLPIRDLRRLHHKCYAESKRLQNRTYREVKLIDVATLYCDHIYLGTLGRQNLANIQLADAIRLAQVLNLHDERLGEPIYDVIQRETRRRVFWLLYGSDRTITALTSGPMHIQDHDLCLPLPLSIDDSLLTTAGAFPQPPHQIPVLAGFHFSSRLFRLLGAVLTAHRQVISSSLHPSSDPFPMLALPPMPMQFRPSQHFFDELDRILTDLPGPLQLVNPTTAAQSSSGGGLGTGQNSTPSGMSSGTGSQHDMGGKPEPAYGTCRANLLVTQAMVRFAIRQYGKAIGEEEGVEGRDWAEKDVLSLLESMSSESLAANGDSLRRKVLFVASSLLEKYPSTTEGHSYVSDFLAVYTRINDEQHTSLLEESAAPSREPSPGRHVPNVPDM